jgi:endonuclease YncB( thermonuclease family)
MAKAIEQLRSGLTVGHARLGDHGAGVGSPAQMVHDGDTVTVAALGNLGVRLLGVDAPEISFRLPGSEAFTPIGGADWEAFLSSPLEARWGAFSTPLTSGLKAHIRARVGAGVATNHSRHALNAQRAFEAEVLSDLGALGKTKEDFEFFIGFAFEVMDRYGRLLGYINRDQVSSTKPTRRPLSYNERLLRLGLVTPYFIWPNVDPFRSKDSKEAAVIPPGKARDEADRNPKLRNALAWVHQAREDGVGLFSPALDGPLRLLPFELRFLAQRRAPDRWVIDLDSTSDVLIHPQRYYTIPKPENRLFIPSEYKPLFEAAGWKAQKS